MSRDRIAFTATPTRLLPFPWYTFCYMRGTVVSVLRGGPSNEHEVSLRSGHTMISHLPSSDFTVRDIFIDKEGVWHERGRPSTPDQILPTTDVALIALHGEYGEDGEVQKVLERFGVPYVGADPFHSYRASHKVFAKEHARELGFKTPQYRFAESIEDAAAVAREVTLSFMQPVVVKPVGGGSSVGISMVGGFQPVHDAITALFNNGAIGVLVEERIRGREATVGVVNGLRGEGLYALPPVEIIPPPQADFFTYDAKYGGESQELCPGNFTKAESDELIKAAKAMHEALGQRHYSRSDFIVSPRGIYFLELNSAAAVGMTAESLFPKSLASVGVTLPDFLSHVIHLALADGRR